MHVALIVLLFYSFSFAQSTGATAPPHSQVKKHKAAATQTPWATPAASPTPDEEGVARMRSAAGLIVIGFFLYWIPAVVGFTRKHHNRGAIAVTNLLLGWTGIGWVAALIWACTNPATAKGAAQ